MKPAAGACALALLAALSSQPVGATASPCAVTIFPRYGTYVRTPRLHGPGLVLDGGGSEDAPAASLRWMHDTIAGRTKRRAGNVVILRASYGNIDDVPFFHDGNFASVQTVLIPPCAARAAVNAAAAAVKRADGVYFAGGDQSHYVAWKGSALIAAVANVYARGGVVGGGSAGLAIQGAVVYDAVAADRLNRDTHTPDALADPLEARMSFTTGLLAWPPLADTITDTHLVVRDRFGRMVVFLARILHDGLLPGARTVYALGIDQASSVVVGPDGMGTVLNAPGGRGAYLVRASGAPRLSPHRPLRWTVQVAHIARNGERFDVLRKRTPEHWHAVTVNGAAKPFYHPDPYDLP